MSGTSDSAGSAAPTQNAPTRDTIDSTDAQSPSTHQRRRSGSGSSASSSKVDNGASTPAQDKDNEPPLPEEDAPPLPDEAPPEDDGWEAMWDSNVGAYYFFNRYTHKSQWDNPRVPEATTAYASSSAPGTTNTSGAPGTSPPPKRQYGGYNPAIHGSYDPNADYAVEARRQEEAEAEAASAVASGELASTDSYGATAQFNRFTGRFQNSSITPENYNDENKSKRQMNAFFDVDAAANSHDGKSLKEERRNKALSKKELKAYKDKRRERKEEKRRAWLRD